MEGFPEPEKGQRLKLEKQAGWRKRGPHLHSHMPALGTLAMQICKGCLHSSPYH